jgi:hypothetical protein
MATGLSTVYAQKVTSANGIVRDSITGEVLPYASIVFEGSLIGTMTDNDGMFNLQNSHGYDLLSISLLGYEKKYIHLKSGVKNEDLNVFIKPIAVEIENIVVRPTRVRYSRRNNPAVDIIQHVIEHKKTNRIENKERYKVAIYEKLSLSIDYFKADMEKNLLLKKLSFMKNYIDTSEFKGKPILTLSIRESKSDYYYRKEPQMEKTITYAKRHQGLDHPFDINGTLSGNLDEIFN